MKRLEKRLHHSHPPRVGHDTSAVHPQAHRFRYALLSFDILIILFIVATSFIERTTWLEIVDVVIGLIILTEFSARLWVSERPLREFAHPATWADILAILSFLAPLAGEGLGFLRILRTLRLLHTYQLVARLRAESTFFRRNEETIVAVVNLGVIGPRRVVQWQC